MADTIESTEPAKTKKPRKVRSKLETLSAQLQRVIKSQAKINHIVKKNGDTVIKARSALIQWGKLPDGASPTATDLATDVMNLIASGFVPPSTRTVTESFVEGQPVKLKDDFVNVYAMVYSAVERDSMTYGFYDEVSKVAMVHTAERTMAVKLKHIEAK